MNNSNREIEVRFLEVDQSTLSKRLLELGAKDLGEDFLREIIFYHPDKEYDDNHRRFVRIRSMNKETVLTYKHHYEDSASGTVEIEFKIEDPKSAEAFMKELGWYQARVQEKERHSFQLGETTVDFDSWPKVPTYVELEGPSEQALKKTAQKLGLDWNKVIFERPTAVLKKYYNIPIWDLKYFTFEKVE